MGAHRPRRRHQVGSRTLSDVDQQSLIPGRAAPDLSDTDPIPARPWGRVVRIIPDVGAIDREFDYLIPESWMADGRGARVTVGSMVRVVLHGRRVAGWVTAVDVEPPHGVKLAELTKLSGRARIPT